MSLRNLHMRGGAGLNPFLAHASIGMDQLMDQDLPHIKRQNAETHTKNRNLAMLKLLAGLSAMASNEAKDKGPLILPTATITCTGAWEQKFSSPFPCQAAHVLPGQIDINGTKVQYYKGLRSDATEYLKELFATVQHLLPCYNRADSSIESDIGPVMGLKNIAALSSRILLRKAEMDPQFIVNVFEREFLLGQQRAIDAAEKERRRTLSTKYPGCVNPQLNDPQAPIRTTEEFAKRMAMKNSELGRLSDEADILEYSKGVSNWMPPPDQVRDICSEAKATFASSRDNGADAPEAVG